MKAIIWILCEKAVAETEGNEADLIREINAELNRKFYRPEVGPEFSFDSVKEFQRFVDDTDGSWGLEILP